MVIVQRRLLISLVALALPFACPHAWGQAKPPAERSGELIVKAQCSKCHQSGVNGAPRIGDREAWIPRVKQGLDTVVRPAIKGHGGMPARGGMADLTDNELRGAVIYMLNAGVGPAKSK